MADFPKMNSSVLAAVTLFIAGFAFHYWAYWCHHVIDAGSTTDMTCDVATHLNLGIVSAACFSLSAVIVIIAFYYNWTEPRYSGKRTFGIY